MRRWWVALVLASVVTALGPPVDPASAGGTDWVALLTREVSASVDAEGLARRAAASAWRRPRGFVARSDASPSRYGQDCIAPTATRLALRHATVAATPTAATFTAGGCGVWRADDLAGGAVAWRVAAPDGSGDADYTVAVVGRELRAVVTDASGEAVFTGEGGLDEDGSVSATVPLEAIGGHAEFGLVVASSDGAGGDDVLAGRNGRPLLHPATAETAVAGAVTVTVAPGSFDAAVAAAEAGGFAVTAPVPGIGVFGVEAVDRGGVAALRALPGVADVRPTTAASLAETPEFYSLQWALHGDHGIRAPVAWQRRTGSGRTVAVVDSGVDGTRADFGNRVLSGWDTRNNQRIPAGENSDIHRFGHGTGVAGIIAADGGHDLAGVDQTARIRPYRFSDAMGQGWSLDVASAIVRATDAGADVINLSLGMETSDRALARAVRYAADRGVVLVAAAGNYGLKGNAPQYPAAYPEVIAVGASTSLGTRAAYSNTGSYVHLVAPGGAGTGSVTDDVLVLDRGSSVHPLAGTSFAAPHVSAAASLYLAGHPAASPTALASALAETARDRGPTGKDAAYGHGLLDLGGLTTRPPRVSAAIAGACPPSAVQRPAFTDVFASSHYEAIACLSWWRITGGVTPTTYAPSERVRRGQMATFLVEVLRRSGVTLPQPVSQGFTDVAGTTHERAINQLAALGVASGTSATTFSPGRPVTRDQMATFILNTHRVASGELLAAAPGSPTVFTDIAGNRHEGAILALSSAGVVSGTGPGTYGPREEVSRAQMASFLMRETSLLVVAGHARLP